MYIPPKIPHMRTVPARVDHAKNLNCGSQKKWTKKWRYIHIPTFVYNKQIYSLRTSIHRWFVQIIRDVNFFQSNVCAMHLCVQEQQTTRPQWVFDTIIHLRANLCRYTVVVVMPRHARTLKWKLCGICIRLRGIPMMRKRKVCLQVELLLSGYTSIASKGIDLPRIPSGTQ